MSRIGKAPIQLPAGVTVTVLAENNVTVNFSMNAFNKGFKPFFSAFLQKKLRAGVILRGEKFFAFIITLRC